MVCVYCLDVPETLREEGEAIMHAEVDQSLQDLKENMQTEKALQKLSLHVQKAADNVKNLPDVGDKLGTIIVGKKSNRLLKSEVKCKTFDILNRGKICKGKLHLFSIFIANMFHSFTHTGWQLYLKRKFRYKMYV
jgi:hypothetical protein